MAIKDYSYPRLSDADYMKAIGQLRLQLNGVFKPFRAYGLQEFIPGAIDECVHLAESFGMRVRGKDEPILMENNPLDLYDNDID
jgi:hypothetical protein